jgi:hypothetical protein
MSEVMRPRHPTVLAMEFKAMLGNGLPALIPTLVNLNENPHVEVALDTQ